MDRRVQMVFPSPPRWLRNLLIALLVAYVVELVLRNDALPTDQLAWHSFEHGFAWYQVPLRFLVQGPSAFGVVFGLLLLYTMGPSLLDAMPWPDLRMGILMGAVGGTVLPLLVDVANLGDAMQTAHGWVPLLSSVLALYGLYLPSNTVYLFFVIPVSGRLIAAFTGVLCALGFLLSPGMASAQPLGMFAGTVGWFYGMGPGARKRMLRNKAAKIEAELKRFEVIEGGKGQGEGNREWVN